MSNDTIEATFQVTVTIQKSEGNNITNDEKIRQSVEEMMNHHFFREQTSEQIHHSLMYLHEVYLGEEGGVSVSVDQKK